MPSSAAAARAAAASRRRRKTKQSSVVTAPLTEPDTNYLVGSDKGVSLRAAKAAASARRRRLANQSTRLEPIIVGNNSAITQSESAEHNKSYRDHKTVTHRDRHSRSKDAHKSGRKFGKGGKLQKDGSSHKLMGHIDMDYSQNLYALDKGDPNYERQEGEAITKTDVSIQRSGGTGSGGLAGLFKKREKSFSFSKAEVLRAFTDPEGIVAEKSNKPILKPASSPRKFRRRVSFPILPLVHFASCCIMLLSIVC